MKIFVVSWFYPPVTTSEALVTYKLLSHSKNEYYLCSASSTKWSYNKSTKLESDNVKQFIIDTDDFEEFNKKALELYKKLSKKIKFDAFMTRAMPPEPQQVGFEIKKINADIPWILSLADPIGNNVYETYQPLYFNRHKIVRNLYFHAPYFLLNKICRFAKNEYLRKLSMLNRYQDKLVKNCDVLIVPSVDQGKFICHNDKLYSQKCLVVPHSYDKKLYSKDDIKNDKYVFSFVGQSDGFRSVEPIVRAVKLIKDLNPDFLAKIEIRLIGNIPSNIINMIYVFFLQNVIKYYGSVDYNTSLKLMQESDCLIHIDACFPSLPNNSIFFAAKIADYMGAKKPILGITSPNSPAGRIICKGGGIVSYGDSIDLAQKMMRLVNEESSICADYYEQFEAGVVAKNYDAELERRLK